MEGVVDLGLGLEDALTGEARTEPDRVCRRIGADDRHARDVVACRDTGRYAARCAVVREASQSAD